MQFLFVWPTSQLQRSQRVGNTVALKVYLVTVTVMDMCTVAVAVMDKVLVMVTVTILFIDTTGHGSQF